MNARLITKQVAGKGWTVVVRIGSKKKGFIEKPATEFQNYTLAQAQSFVSNNRVESFLQ